MQPHSTRTPYFPENLDQYAQWVAKFGLLYPYGQCQCGCGRTTPLTALTKPERGQVKGEPLRYCASHWHHALSLEEAFWKYVRRGEQDDCWEWQKVLGEWGYGVVCYRQERLPAHRVSYELHHGPIPEGMCVCHECDNPACVNPKHLFLGTNDDNIADRTRKGRSAHGDKNHCAKLRSEDIPRIRELRRAGLSCPKIAAMFGVTYQTIQAVVKRITWKHVP